LVAPNGLRRPRFSEQSLRAAEQQRPDVQEARQNWPNVVLERQAERLIFLDETWFTTAMSRLYGYALRGERLVDYVPHGHWKTTTFVGGLTTEGFIAPMVLDGAMNAAAFIAYIEQVLAKETRPEDLVILDNLSSHKTAGVQAALDRCGIDYRYLPPYSPDLNPIENAFSKLKRLVRSAVERTVEGLWNAIGRLLDQFRPDECRNYFRHCGYSATKT
jgi:transposase